MELGETTPFQTTDGVTLMARRLTPSDTPALQAFNAALEPPSRRWFQPHAYDPETVRKILARSEAGEDLVLGLFAGEPCVGYFFLWYFRERVPLLGIGLRDAYQRRGLGQQLLTFLIAAARRNGNEGIELTTDFDNPHAFALYKLMGFRYYRDVENLQGNGAVVTERAMFYPLKPGAQPMTGTHRPPV